MSNSTFAGGLRLKKASDARTETVYVPSTDSTPIGVGDAVKVTAAGVGSIGGGPSVVTVARCAAGDVIYGVVQGTLPHYSDGTGSMDLSKSYRPASTAMYLTIRPANHTDVYEITDDGSGTIAYATDMPLNANLVVADCSTVTGLSNMQLDATTPVTTATYQLHMVGPATDIRNDVTSANARWLVTLNHIYRSGGTGVAGV